MKHYRIYFLAPDGKIDGRPAELQAASDNDVVMRALLAERNAYGAEVWCGATLVRRVAQPGGAAFAPSAGLEVQAGRQA